MSLRRTGASLLTALALSLAAGCEQSSLGGASNGLEGGVGGALGGASSTSPSGTLGSNAPGTVASAADGGAGGVTAGPPGSGEQTGGAMSTGGAAGGFASGVSGMPNVAGSGGSVGEVAAGGNSSGMSGTGGASTSGGSGGGRVDNTPRPTVTAAPGTDLVDVDVTALRQSFEGWGTSLCWWAHHVGGWEEAARNAVVEAVVDPVDGLGYNIFRYNIGGGENPAHEHMERHREMPGFQDADGSWNWDSDANQRAILLRIAERGSEVIFEAFSNSPPYWMTNSGCASGSNDGSDNLKPDAYDDFAHYLTEVVKHYRDEYGITFRTLEPLNEPYANWWRADGSQEGCHFGPSSQERIIQELAQQLVDKGLDSTVISASDENSMDDALRNLEAFSADTISAIQQINVHSYAGSNRRGLRELAARLGKRLWQSESGPLGQSIDDDTDAALFMAARIIEDLRELQPEAWLDWQTGDPSRSWASLTLNDGDQTYSPLKRFYMHANFSRYIRPGATFVEVNDADMVAALSPDERSLTLVVRNGDRSASHGYTIDLTSLPSVGATASAHRTSRTENLAALEPIAVEDYRVVVTAPPFSVTTFVIELP